MFDVALGYQKRITFDFASGSTFSTAVNIAGAPYIAFELPAFTACLSTESANVYVNVAHTKTGTYRRVKDMGIYSAASGIQDWEVGRSIGNYTVVCRAASGFNWAKLETTQGATFNATCTAGMTCYAYLGR